VVAEAKIYLTGRQFRYALPFRGRLLRAVYVPLGGLCGLQLKRIDVMWFARLDQEYGSPRLYAEQHGEIYLWPIPDHGCNKIVLTYEGAEVSERTQRLLQAINNARAHVTLELRRSKLQP